VVTVDVCVWEGRRVWCEWVVVCVGVSVEVMVVCVCNFGVRCEKRVLIVTFTPEKSLF
jgi:hypothetical protein